MVSNIVVFLIVVAWMNMLAAWIWNIGDDNRVSGLSWFYFIVSLCFAALALGFGIGERRHAE